jgi:N-acyl-D-amino-acid deacylase
MRRDEPDGLVIVHIIDDKEIEACITRPECIIASDTFYRGEGIHPRTYGTFPKALNILRCHGYSWSQALKKVTSMPADTMGIPSGRLIPGRAADIVVFDPDNFLDKATYQNSFTPPSGVKLVLVGGEIAARDGKVFREPHGRLIPYIRWTR